MKTALRAGLGVLLAASPVAALPGTGCPPQPVPDPLDSVRPVGVFVIEAISLSAAPSLASPPEAWVVRAFRETVFDQDSRERTMLEVIRLEVEHDCNRHFVTGRWEGELEPAKYTALRETVATYLEPVAGAIGEGRLATDELAIDGTSLSVELDGFLWRARREGNLAMRSGAGVSTAFHALASELVPPREAPTAEWRRRPPE